MFDASQESIIYDLSEICKRIIGLLRIKIIDVGYAVLQPISNHVFSERIVHEVGFV